MPLVHQIVTPLVFLASSTLLAASIPGGATRSAGAAEPPLLQSTDLGELRPGESVFEDGEHVASSRGGFAGALAYFLAPPAGQPPADPCLTGSGYCRLYEVEVIGSGTLRVAIDSSKRGECFALELRNPKKLRVPEGGFPNICPEFVEFSAQAFNIEIPVPKAEQGVWQIRVMGPEVEDWAYRVRAALEGAPPAEPDLLAPNLTPWLPSEFGFVAPGSASPGTAMDHQNPPGPAGISCHAQDTAGGEEPRHTKCLRFSAGLYNIGNGPLYVRFDATDTPYQHVYYRDATPGQYGDNEARGPNPGGYLEQKAGMEGSATFHAEHKHRHFADMVLYQLFEVSDPLPLRPPRQGKVLTEVGQGDKHGYCTFSQRIERWSAFRQDAQMASFPVDSCNTAMTLERGWGDVYRWQRPGEFVPYDAVADLDGTMKAGFYVVRITVDPSDLLLETKESDNTGYAYIQVVDGSNGDQVIVCEQGYGKSPWDPNKKIVEDGFMWANKLQDRNFEPEACSPR